MSNYFRIDIDQHFIHMFNDVIFGSDSCEFISEDYLKNKYFHDNEEHIYDINECFILYLDDQMNTLLNVNLLDKNFIIDPECEKIINSKKIISETYEETIDKLFNG